MALFNPLSPNIHIQILQTELYIFPLRKCWENFIKDQGIFSLVTILVFLITQGCLICLRAVNKGR